MLEERLLCVLERPPVVPVRYENCGSIVKVATSLVALEKLTKTSSA